MNQIPELNDEQISQFYCATKVLEENEVKKCDELQNASGGRNIKLSGKKHE
jgi:hypothetical protein